MTMISSAVTHRSEPPVGGLVPLLPTRTRLDVIKPLLGDLETATTAGLRYVMGKVLVQLREAAAAAQHRLPDAAWRSVRDALAELTRESDRMLPNAGAFAIRARTVTAALSPA
jgi:hypothetical protein